MIRKTKSMEGERLHFPLLTFPYTRQRFLTLWLTKYKKTINFLFPNLLFYEPNEPNNHNSSQNQIRNRPTHTTQSQTDSPLSFKPAHLVWFGGIYKVAHKSTTHKESLHIAKGMNNTRQFESGIVTEKMELMECWRQSSLFKNSLTKYIYTLDTNDNLL